MYTRLWRNKFLTLYVTSLDEMVVALTDAAAELQAISATGKVTLDSGGVADDYAVLLTDDPDVAQQFGFTQEDESTEEDNE